MTNDSKALVCLWYEKDAEGAARFYASQGGVQAARITPRGRARGRPS